MDRGFNLEALLEDLLGQGLSEDNNEQWLDYNSKLAKLFGKLKKDTGAEMIRQNYRGTGSKKFRRQMWVRWPNGGSMDIWLDDGEVMFGGIVSILPGGDRIEAPKKQIPYGEGSPEETYKAVVANLKNWLKDAKVAAPESSPAKTQAAPVAAAARAPEVAKTTPAASKSIFQEASKLSKGDFVEISYRQSGGSPNKSATYEVTSGPYTSGSSTTWGLKNTKSKAGRGSVLNVDKADGEVAFQLSATSEPVNIISFTKGVAVDDGQSKNSVDYNPDKLNLSDFTKEFLSTGRAYVIRKHGDSYSLTGPRGAVYHGIRNKHSGTIRFIEKPVEKISITDRDGVVRIRN